jgi:trk system potassium uptake protein TrkH
MSEAEVGHPEALGPRGTWSRRVRRFRSGLLGGLAAAGPSAVLLIEAPSVLEVLALAGASAALAGTALHQGRGGDGRLGLLLAAGAALLALGPTLIYQPGWSFAFGALALAILSWRRRPSRREGLEHASPDVLPVWGVLGPAVPVALLAALVRAPSQVFVLSAAATSALAALLGAAALRALDLEPGARRAWAALWVALALGAGGASDLGLRCALLVGAGGVPLAAERAVRRGPAPFASVAAVVSGRPELLLATGFGATISVGAVLLALPAASVGARVLAPIDAVFTAVSATCVTGLIVVDTPAAFSPVGQGVILLLIQLGGLGIMTFSTAALFVLRKRPSLRHERALADVFVAWEGHDPASAVRRILLVTFVAEGLGALLLAARFATSHGEGVGAALWRGLFTAVSAFCNAGFALQTDSLVPYQEDAVVTMVVATLVFVGALGPVVVVALRVESRRSRALVVRLVVLTSLALAAVGSLLFLALEWRASLGALGWPDRLHNAVFQSVTLRTAGFNSVDFAELLPETRAWMLGFMFIGGAPGSTAGGIKVTTFAVILLSVAAAVRGRPEAVFMSRRISHDTFYRAAAIFVLGLGSVVGLWMALLLTQTLPPLEALFEAVSALGTVGLSLGATAELDEVGKVLVSIGMFAGRLGPVTMLFLFAAERRPPKWGYPEVELPVG